VNGTIVRDVIRYEVGFGIFGKWAQSLLLVRRLKETFEYRQMTLEKLLAQETQPGKPLPKFLQGRATWRRRGGGVARQELNSRKQLAAGSGGNQFCRPHFTGSTTTAVPYASTSVTPDMISVAS
jgi:hypothetical protein